MSDISFPPVDANRIFGDVIETRGQWYPIETAPENEWIIVFNNQKTMSISLYEKDDDGDAWWRDSEGGWSEPEYGECQIIYWMPLPAPPKE